MSAFRKEGVFLCLQFYKGAILRIRPLALFALFAFLERREKFEYSFYKLRRIDADDFVHICPLFYTKYVSETACVKTGKQKNGNRRFFLVYI